MNSSQGLKESGFDVLHSQAEDTSSTYQIPIKKVGFSEFRQPTELSPSEVLVTKKEVKVETPAPVVETEKGFDVPKELIGYIDALIIQKKLPIKTLKFDIEFAKSADEIAKYLEDYADSKTIPEDDLDKLFGFIGYARNDTSNSENVSGGTNKHIPHNEVEDFFGKPEVESPAPAPAPAVETAPEPIKVEAKIESNTGLLEARVSYVDQLVPYLQKKKKDFAVYAKIMAELGGNSDMPFTGEPKELSLAREEYLKARRESGVRGIVDEIEEVEVLRAEVLKTLDAEMKMRLEKFSTAWDRYLNSQLVAESLLTDINAVEKIVDPAPFDGLRTTPEAQVQPEVVVPMETTVQQVEIQPEAIVATEIPVESERPEVVAEEKRETTPPVEPPKTEFKFEIVGEGQKIEEEAKKLAENTGNPPVDISVAEKGPAAQNVFPSEFDGKKMEIIVGSPEVSPQIRVVWDNKEIAQGSIVKGKPVVKINKNFYSGILFTDTKEEKALKFAMPIINTLRS